MYLFTRNESDMFDIEVLFKRYNSDVDGLIRVLKEFIVCSTASLMNKEILSEFHDNRMIPEEQIATRLM